MRMTLVAGLLSAVISLPVLAGQTAAPPLVKPENLKQISPHVHVITDDSVPMVPNVGIVVGEKAALVIDTGLGARNGAVVLNAARKVAGAKPLYLVSTHVHPEHDLGAQGLPADAQMIRAAAQVKEIDLNGTNMADNFRRISPLHRELLEGAVFRKADITFEKEHSLDLGGLTVRLIATGPTHTIGDTTVWIEADRVLFSGDVAMLGMPSVTAQSSLRQWLAVLDQLEALKPAIIVPSHGPVGDGKFITTYRAYFTEIRTLTAAEKKAGASAEQATERVTAAIGTRFPTNRIAGAISAAFREAP